MAIAKKNLQFVKNKSENCYNKSRGVYRIHPRIYDGAFSENSQQLSVIFAKKKLNQRYSTGF